jgi:hypothetical protein
MPDAPKPAAVVDAAIHIEEQIESAQEALESGDIKTAQLIKKELDEWLTSLPSWLKDQELPKQFSNLKDDVAALRNEIKEALKTPPSILAPPSESPPPSTTQPEPPPTNVSEPIAPAEPPVKPAATPSDQKAKFRRL